MGKLEISGQVVSQHPAGLPSDPKSWLSSKRSENSQTLLSSMSPWFHSALQSIETHKQKIPRLPLKPNSHQRASVKSFPSSPSPGIPSFPDDLCTPPTTYSLITVMGTWEERKTREKPPCTPTYSLWMPQLVPDSLTCMHSNCALQLYVTLSNKTGRPGVLQSMGLQRFRHDWATELNWNATGAPSWPVWTER